MQRGGEKPGQQISDLNSPALHTNFVPFFYANCPLLSLGSRFICTQSKGVRVSCQKNKRLGGGFLIKQLTLDGLCKID